jgi:hypothetical protein
VPGGVVTVAYLPELFHLEPARPDEDPVRFVLAPDERWLEAQTALWRKEAVRRGWPVGPREARDAGQMVLPFAA